MNKEEQEKIKHLIKEYEIQFDEYKVEFLPITFDKGTYLSLKKALNYISKLQKENEEIGDELYRKTDKLQTENANYKELILNIKQKLNNIQFEVEQAWRKIEKLENNNE